MNSVAIQPVPGCYPLGLVGGGSFHSAVVPITPQRSDGWIFSVMMAAVPFEIWLLSVEVVQGVVLKHVPRKSHMQFALYCSNNTRFELRDSKKDLRNCESALYELLKVDCC